MLQQYRKVSIKDETIETSLTTNIFECKLSTNLIYRTIAKNKVEDKYLEMKYTINLIK